MCYLEPECKVKRKHIVPYLLLIGLPKRSFSSRLKGFHATIRSGAMSSSQKKVILRRFLGDVLFGYLPAAGFVDRGEIQYLNLQGRVAGVALGEVKTVCYVRDFNLNDPANPERLQRKSFVARPRGDGLWIRVVFREDGDVLEGLAAPDASLLDGLTADQGLFLAPPDTRSNTQRVYVPRAAIASIEILAVITSPMKRGRPVAEVADSLEVPKDVLVQETLFDGAPAMGTKRGKHGRR